MPLPPPSEITEGEYWDYWIRTPTFRLEPIEKPDMSRYLIHMTGKGELLSIIQGDDPNDDKGRLRASVPHYDRRDHTEAAVCFTESPIFALDFFRYKSKSRWERDHRYGIGFYKTDLVDKGVRPLITTDAELSRVINSLNHDLADDNIDLQSMSDKHQQMVKHLIRSVYNLNFPLLEDRSQQGFTWEKEWRLPGGVDLEFEHQMVKIICCPEEESDKLKEALKSRANFVNHWDQYNEVTDFLRRRIYHLEQSGLARLEELVDLAALKLLRRKTRYTLNSLDKYAEATGRMSVEAAQDSEGHIQDMKNYLERLDDRIVELEQDSTTEEA